MLRWRLGARAFAPRPRRWRRVPPSSCRVRLIFILRLKPSPRALRPARRMPFPRYSHPHGVSSFKLGLVSRRRLAFVALMSPVDFSRLRVRARGLTRAARACAGSCRRCATVETFAIVRKNSKVAEGFDGVRSAREREIWSHQESRRASAASRTLAPTCSARRASPRIKTREAARLKLPSKIGR